jgi:hypothetical protein
LDKKSIISQIILILSTAASFGLGSLTASLGIIRGVGIGSLVFFLLVKSFDTEEDEDKLIGWGLASGILMSSSIVGEAGLVTLHSTLSYIFSPFSLGILFFSTFAYFAALINLTLNSKHIIFNIIFILSAAASFGLGGLTASLRMIRGVGIGFFVCFLLLKSIKIKWGSYWCVGLLGVGLFIYGSCLIIKSEVEYYVEQLI